VRGLDSVGTFGAAGYAILGKADWSELLANPEVTSLHLPWSLLLPWHPSKSCSIA
jgi:hypothetical protein